MSFYWVRKRTAVKKRLASRKSRSPGKVVFHTAAFLLIVLDIFVTSSGLFGNVLVRSTHNNTWWNQKLLFVVFFQQTPCITGLSLCSSWNSEKLMEVCGISHAANRNGCSTQTQVFYEPPKPLFQHLFLKHSTRPLVWKWCIAVFRKFIYCLVDFPQDSTVKCMSQSLTT